MGKRLIPVSNLELGVFEDPEGFIPDPSVQFIPDPYDTVPGIPYIRMVPLVPYLNNNCIGVGKSF